MSSQKKRAYHSTVRQAQAAQTKNQILQAAKQLFQMEGIDTVTIDQIAERANVSAPTIYALFQSKRGILRAIIDNALDPNRHEALVAAAKRESSPKDRIVYAARIARELYDAERKQMETLWGLSILTPEFKELEKEREQRRYQRLKESIQTLAKENALQRDLNITKAWDILWVFTGRDFYRLFVVELGWSSDDYEKWLSQTLVKTLIESK